MRFMEVVKLINEEMFKEVLSVKNTNQEAIAKAIGMHFSTFYRKVKNGGDTFTIGEIEKMVEVIPLTKKEAKSIFL